MTRVLEVVASIPSGRAMTYGDVAAALGSRAARAVGSVMAHYGSDVPWWRVVRAGGHPAVGHSDAALQHFRAEGTLLLWSADGAYRVDLGGARYHPGGSVPAAAAAAPWRGEPRSEMTDF